MGVYFRVTTFTDITCQYDIDNDNDNGSKNGFGLNLLIALMAKYNNLNLKNKLLF